MLKCKKDAVTNSSVPFLPNGKKGIGPVVAIALLIVVSVVAVIGFQTWFGTYSSDLFVKTEKDSSSTSNTNIETLIGDQLYFKNTLDDNISIKQIKIGNKECNISLNLTKGVHNISLGNCTNNLTLSSSVSDVVVITDKKVYTKKHLFKDVNIASQSVSSPTPPVVSSYELNNSLLFDGVDDYLSWTPTQEGNRTTVTFSFWLKKTELNSSKYLAIFRDNGLFDGIQFYDNRFDIFFAGAASYRVTTSSKHRDSSDWVHYLISIDTTKSTASDRVKIYSNGIEEKNLEATQYPPKDYNLGTNSVAQHLIGHLEGNVNFFVGYMSEVNFIDGQALTPGNFGEFNNYGKWVPKKYEGTYGQNGFHLTFENASNLGQDFSGNNNTWTVNGGPIQTKDNPTNNFATLNPLTGNVQAMSGSYTFSKGNLKVTTPASGWKGSGLSTLELPSSGKWYFEAQNPNYFNHMIGISRNHPHQFPGSHKDDYGLYVTGQYYENYVLTNYGNPWSHGDYIGVLFDADNKKLSFNINGINQGNLTLSDVNGYHFSVGDCHNTAHTWNVNFGATPFQYSIPEGYKTLSSKNLPTPTVIPKTGFDVLTYTGTGVERNISGLDFSPSLVWIKNRDQGDSHKLFDIIRGPTKYIESNSVNSEAIETNGLTTFNSDGFSLGTGANGYNDLNEKFVAWNWKEGPEYGFDIVNYTGNGIAGNNILHNLGKEPEMMIIKNIDESVWDYVYHKNVGELKRMSLGLNLAEVVDNEAWNNIKPNSTHFTLGIDGNVNYNSKEHIAYLFTSIPGFSKVGSYTGNGNADGPFIYTGFKPKYVMIKSTDLATHWKIIDSQRDNTNPITPSLNANDNLDEATTYMGSPILDFTSNGFKLRMTNSNINGNGNNYIYIAFAEYPLSTNY